MVNMRRKPSAVLFDFFNTIVRRVNFDPEMGIRTLLKLAKKPSSISIHEVLVRNTTLEDRLCEVWDTSDVWSTSQQFQRLLFDGLGVNFDARPDELERCFFEAAMEFERTEGIQRCLSELRSRGLRLGVVSNHNCTGESLRSALSHLEIADPFEFVVSSADYGIGKPHPLIFETAVAKLGVESSTTWFVGDNLENDIAGANEAGLFSVWYNPDENESGRIEPNATIRSWEEFEELIETVG
ncbi:MAG: HAD family hydrolase [Gemmatimonadetes bacterium]|nr:HAD family hydrolase [Gemmatimonadota bacterium]